MDSTLRIILIANAGLLLTYRGTTLMIDGIYGREGHPFSNLSPEVWREMLGSEDRFQKVDYLLFTHAHPDHFSPEMTGEFLRHRDVKGLFPIKAAFVNPLFFNALCHRKFFKVTLPGQSIFVYHVPFPEDDSMWMLPTLRRSLEAWPPDGRPVTALTEPFQEIEL